MTMNDESRTISRSTPADLAGVERLLERLGAHERSLAPFGMEERVAEGSGAITRALNDLGAAEAAMAGAGFESRIFAGSRVTAAGICPKTAAMIFS